MNEVSKEKILAMAQALEADNKTWHYHLLTPACQFNESQRYAILLEDINSQQTFVYYSDAAEMELSNRLSGMLHGEEVLQQANTSSSYHPSDAVRELLKLIDRLEGAGTAWHHHVFFLGCVFNSHKGEYELVVEDPEEGSYLVSVSGQEPKEDLKQIEQRFYNQKNL